MTNANEPINPIPDLNEHPSHWYGLTKREYFAAMALQGLLANPNTASQIRSCFGFTDADESNKIVANTSCKLADALINALNETK